MSASPHGSAAVHPDVLPGGISFQRVPLATAGSGALGPLAGARGAGMLGVAQLQTQLWEWAAPAGATSPRFLRPSLLCAFLQKELVKCLRVPSPCGVSKPESDRHGSRENGGADNLPSSRGVCQQDRVTGSQGPATLLLGPWGRGGRAHLTTGRVSSQHVASAGMLLAVLLPMGWGMGSMCKPCRLLPAFPRLLLFPPPGPCVLLLASPHHHRRGQCRR